MGAAARDYVRRKFRRDAYLDGLLGVYRQAMQDRRANARPARTPPVRLGRTPAPSLDRGTRL